MCCHRLSVQIAVLTEKLQEAVAQLASHDKLRAADAANIRQYMNENDALRKKYDDMAGL
jgi:hypothetical protein